MKPKWKQLFEKYRIVPGGNTSLKALEDLLERYDDLQLRYRNAIMDRIAPAVLAGEIAAILKIQGLSDKQFNIETLAQSYRHLERKFGQVTQENALLRKVIRGFVSEIQSINDFHEVFGLQSEEES